MFDWWKRIDDVAALVDERARLVQTITILSGVSGMDSVREALEAELRESLAPTVIDEVAPVIITGGTMPSNPGNGPNANSQILHGEESDFEDEDGTLVQLFGDEVQFAVAVESETFETAVGDFTFSAVGADGEAGYWIGVSSDGVEIGGSASAEVYLVQGEYSLDTEYLDLGAQVSVGAEAELVAAVEFQPFDGDLRVEAGGELGVNASVGVEGQLGPDELNVQGAAEVGVGLGLEGGVDAGFEDWSFGFDVDAGVYIGVGIELDLGFEVDVGAIGSGAWNAGGAVVDWIQDPWPW